MAYQMDIPDHATLDLQALFEAVPDLYVVVQPSDDYPIVAVSAAFLQATMVKDGLLTSFIPALDNGTNPSGGIAEHERHLIWGVALLHQPQKVPMRPFNGGGCASIAVMELFSCHFGGHGHSFCHAYILH